MTAFKAKRGASAIGYGLLIGLISVIGLGAITSVGSETDKLFGNVGTTLDDVVENNVSSPSPSPIAAQASCAAHYLNGQTLSGNYPISLPGAGTVNLYCDMADGGWTLVMRGYGGDNGSWVSATGAVGTAHGATPTMTASYKLSDSDINAVRNNGIYRIAYNGNAAGFTTTPPTVYVSSSCTYDHSGSSTGCRTWSLNQSFSPSYVSATNVLRLGIVVGSTSTGSGFLHYLTNFNDSNNSEDGWYSGNITVNSAFCYPATAGCDMVMFVK